MSPYYNVIVTELTEALKILNFKNINDIICYGLGNFSDLRSSRFQLALILTVKILFSSTVYIYDPLFTENEIKCLISFELNVIPKNEEGKRIIRDCPTLVFMPHCSKQLTNNFLYANWSNKINNCILLGMFS